MDRKIHFSFFHLGSQIWSLLSVRICIFQKRFNETQYVIKVHQFFNSSWNVDETKDHWRQLIEWIGKDHVGINCPTLEIWSFSGLTLKFHPMIFEIRALPLHWIIFISLVVDDEVFECFQVKNVLNQICDSSKLFSRRYQVHNKQVKCCIDLFETDRRYTDKGLSFTIIGW